MALLFCDNFQRYGTDTYASPPAGLTEGEVYAEAVYVNPIANPDPSETDLVLGISSNGASNITGTIRKVLPAAIPVGTPIGCGFRCFFPNLPGADSSTHTIFHALDSGAGDIVGVRVRTDGYLEVRRGTNLALGTAGTVVGVSNGPVIVAGAWQQIEIKCVIHATTGSFEVRVDGVVALNLTNVNTGNADCTQIKHTSYHSSATWYMKDYFIWDTSGSLNNNFIGNCFVHSMVPDGDVSGTWSVTGGAGPAYDALDEADPDDDTSYISSAWPAATAEVVTLSDLPPDATRVLGMMTLVRSMKTDGGDASLVHSLVSATNTVDGATTPITTAYSYWTDIFETDPDTSAAWTVGAANAVKLKIDRTA